MRLSRAVSILTMVILAVGVVRAGEPVMRTAGDVVSVSASAITLEAGPEGTKTFRITKSTRILDDEKKVTTWKSIAKGQKCTVTSALASDVATEIRPGYIQFKM